MMPFGIGGHPGFNVHLLEGEKFEDYELVFQITSRPDRVGFSKSVYFNGQEQEYLLCEERFIVFAA